MEKLDADSVEVISTYYIKDKNHVFYQNQLLPDADAAFFGIKDKRGIGHKNGPFRGAERFEPQK